MFIKDIIFYLVSLCGSRQHVFSPHGRFRPLPSGADFSGLLRLFRHFRRSCFHLCVPQHSPSCNAFAPCQLLHFIATMIALTPARRFFDPLGGHEHHPCPDRSPCLTHITSRHSAANHPMTHRSRFSTIPLNAAAMTSSNVSGLRHSFASSSHHMAESLSSSCGLPVLFPLLSTLHRCNAVTFRYRPEIVYLEGTCTPL